MEISDLSLLAFYLPQYHPIPENDKWWGNGFTEWTNVTKAKPLFRNHRQPHLPSDLGFYDLRVPETRLMQAKIARDSGITGFCYWHYWFGAGKRILERPFREVLESGSPDFPFCLAWANHSWSGIWVGSPDKILLEQTYPGKEDYKSHFLSVLSAFNDPRYLRINGRPIFVVFEPYNIPNQREFTDYWQELSRQQGLPGIYFVGMSFSTSWNHRADGFDGFTTHPPKDIINRFYYGNRKRSWKDNLSLKYRNILKYFKSKPRRYDYRELMPYMIPTVSADNNFFPNIIPGWDNTPRSGKNGYVFENSNPALFGDVLQNAVRAVVHKPKKEQIIFIQAWNEWAEGNYLEPDQKWGHAYLEKIHSVIGIK